MEPLGWSDADDALLTEKFKIHGPHWSQLQQFFPGRTAVNVKNRWTTLTARRNKAEREQRVSQGKVGLIPQTKESGRNEPSGPLTSEANAFGETSEFDHSWGFGLDPDDIFGFGC
jgi:hypothetical protein